MEDSGIGFELRRALAKAMQLLYRRGLVNLRGGNASARLRLPNGLTWIYITPSGKPKEMLEPDDIAVLDPLGNVVRGEPSIEYKLHLLIYEARPEVNAIVHSHNPLTLAAHEAKILNDAFRESLEARYYIGPCLGVVKPYEPGSEELARRTAEAMDKCNAAILERHGVVTVGVNSNPIEAIYEAVDRAEVLEDIAKIALYSRRRTN
ncbi:MAG: class II aldolase/adducin family protein [Pyrodictiaceae archaeon]